MLNTLFSYLKRKYSPSPCRKNGKFHYSGNYRNGKASYHYNESENGRIYEGAFRFHIKYYGNSHVKTRDDANGYFKHGYKNGNWTLRRKSSDVIKVLDVCYADGLHEGTYHFHGIRKAHAIGSDSGHTDLELHMHNGHPTGEVKCRFGNEIVSGHCDEEGCPDGMWTMDLSKTKECCMYYEVWEHGVRKDSYTVDISTGNKKHVERSVVDIVTSFVYSECLPLERIISKGSHGWHGNFATSRGGKFLSIELSVSHIA